MADKNKYEGLKKFVAATMAAGSLATSSGLADASAPTHAPATTQPINQVDQSHWTPEQRKFFESTQNELNRAGIHTDYLDPFPEQPPLVPGEWGGDGNTRMSATGGVAETDGGKKVSVVVGLARQGEEMHRMFGGIVSADPELAERIRTVAYFHELAHRVLDEKGQTETNPLVRLQKKIAQRIDKNYADTVSDNLPQSDARFRTAKMLRDGVKDTLVTGIKESAADITSVIFSMEKMKNPEKPIEAVRARRVVDRATPGHYDPEHHMTNTEQDHNTVAVLDAAVAAYKKNPPANKSFRAAAEWSAEFVAGHEDLMFKDFQRRLNLEAMRRGHQSELSPREIAVAQRELRDADIAARVLSPKPLKQKLLAP